MKVVTGRQDTVYRMLTTGTEGIGKSTFAGMAEGVIFGDIERSTPHLDVARMANSDGSPLASYADLKTAIEWLLANQHSYKVLALDTLDALNAWIEQHICAENTWKSIESPGYGKGFTAALEEWRRFFALLERLQRTKNMSIISVAHAQLRKVSPPDGEPYDIYDLKLPDKPAALAREWHDTHLFARIKVITAKKEGARPGDRAKAFDTGEREVITRERSFAKAKNRWCLPAVMEWDPTTTFGEIDRLRRRDPAVLLAALFEKSEKARENETATREWFARQPDKLFAVQRLADKLGVEV